jgi:hypothetical protein
MLKLGMPGVAIETPANWQIMVLKKGILRIEVN